MLLISALAAADPTDEILPHTLFRLPFGDYVFTNQMMMVCVSALLMLLIFPALFARADGSAPSGAKNFFESILEFLRIEVFRPALKEHTDRFVPFLWTLFFFILFANLLGQIPVAEMITLFTHKESHLWGTATGTPITTGALAICAFVFIHVNGILQIARSLMDGTYGHHAHHEEHSTSGHHGQESAQDLEHVRSESLAADLPGNFAALKDPTAHYADGDYKGDAHAAHGGAAIMHDHAVNPVLAVLMAIPLYLWNFAPHPFRPQPGAGPAAKVLLTIVDMFAWAGLCFLEGIGAIIKPFALMIRLFANMIAGHIVLGSLVLLIPLASGIGTQVAAGIPVTALSLMIRCLELFVAFLQAYVFTFLVTLFIASAVAPEH